MQIARQQRRLATLGAPGPGFPPVLAASALAELMRLLDQWPDAASGPLHVQHVVQYQIGVVSVQADAAEPGQRLIVSVGAHPNDGRIGSPDAMQMCMVNRQRPGVAAIGSSGFGW